MASRLLIFTPTYNEAGNIEQLIREVYALNLPIDMLVIDDGSPDGTGNIVERLSVEFPGVTLHRRSGKLGIGTAHLTALRYAKAKGYDRLVSLDADFSHKPTDIPRLLERAEAADIVVGTRFARKNSLSEWSLFRRGMTHLGHALTHTLLNIPYDASGGLRVYNLAKVSNRALGLIQSRDYEFFFESLTILHLAGLSVAEVPIDLPARTYGHSKMQVSHITRGVSRLMQLATRLRLSSGKIRKQLSGEDEMTASTMKGEWDEYWSAKDHVHIESSAYDVVASFYRNFLIRPTLDRTIRAAFPKDAQILHAGCGGGEVDANVVAYANVTALDISPNALSLYSQRHGARCKTMIGNIMDLSNLPMKYDGLYNLGVMEHFSQGQIATILTEFNRALAPNGRIVLFWPPVYGLSVAALATIHFVLNDILKRNVQLHPAEPSKVRSRKEVTAQLQAAGFELEKMSFGLQDAFTYAIIVGRKVREAAPGPEDQQSAPSPVRAVA